MRDTIASAWDLVRLLAAMVRHGLSAYDVTERLRAMNTFMALGVRPERARELVDEHVRQRRVLTRAAGRRFSGEWETYRRDMTRIIVAGGVQ